MTTLQRVGDRFDGKGARAELERSAVLQRTGRLPEAREAAEVALKHAPDSAEALSRLGVILAQQGDLATAARLLERALAIDGSAVGHNNLGLVRQQLGRSAEAAQDFERALVLKPGYAVALNNLGAALATLQRHDEAIARYREAIEIDPNHAEAWSNLGVALLAVGSTKEAVGCLKTALTIRPDSINTWQNLGHALIKSEKHEQAIPCFERVAEARPGEASVQLALADALRSAGRPAEAAAHYERALTIDTRLAPAHGGLAIAYLELGRLKDAERHVERAMELDPKRPAYFQTLTRLKKLGPDDPHLKALLALKEDIASFTEAEATDLHFALGKALSDVGRFDEAFAQLLDGNALKRRSLSYNEAPTLRRIERIRTVFTPRLLDDRRGGGDPSDAPLFIVGMPRSGSTLVEQILASHPDVHGTGEVDFFARAIKAVGLNKPDRQYPESLLADAKDTLSALGADYLARLRSRSEQESAAQRYLRICDKMLNNFRFCGLIHLALPNARIIHTRRDPIETCLSCFSIQFATLPFTYDLAELGAYYRAYDRLMNHWREVLPPQIMLEVTYEEVVQNFEAEARRLLVFCGLEWNDACARFYEAKRPVRTSSLVQVRQPIYHGSIKRWRPSSDALQPLLDALNGQTEPTSRTTAIRAM